MTDLVVSDSVTIPESELLWRFETSGGPGGQHANKSATRAILTFDVEASSALSAGQRQAILRTEGSPIVISADATRSQWRNRQQARQRLAERIRTALRPPPPPRKKTRPSRRARQRRLDAKKQRQETKQRRRKPQWD